VTAVFAILILLIAAAPVLTIMGGILSAGFLLAMAALAIALIVLTSPTNEFSRLGALWKPIIPFALIPCIWMLVQLAPVPGWLAHSAWASASAALDQSITGAITLDIGATLLGLCLYSLALAIAIIATAVALDRRRAETILFGLMAAAGLTAATLIGLDVGFSLFTDLGHFVQRPQMWTVALLGFILSCATALRAYEHSQRQRATDASTWAAATASIAVMAICLSAIATSAHPAVLLAAASGVFILVGLAVIRRLRLGPWEQSGIAAAGIIALIGLSAAIPANRVGDIMLAWPSEPQVSIETAERMLADAKWVGTGAGTFAALLPIYRDVDDADFHAAPTAAVAIAIEMGRPLLWLLVIAALVSALSLVKRALMRGREYIYAGTGAACIVAVLVSSFANAGILGLGASLLTSVVCGLALAQSRSWSV
jgi:hypothetical protein